MSIKNLKTGIAAIGAAAIVLVLIATTMPYAYGVPILPSVTGSTLHPEPLALLGVVLLALGSLVRTRAGVTVKAQ